MSSPPSTNPPPGESQARRQVNSAQKSGSVRTCLVTSVVLLITLLAAAAAFFGTCIAITLPPKGNFAAGIVLGVLAAGVVVALGIGFLVGISRHKKRDPRQ